MIADFGLQNVDFINGILIRILKSTAPNHHRFNTLELTNSDYNLSLNLISSVIN